MTERCYAIAQGSVLYEKRSIYVMYEYACMHSLLTDVFYSILRKKYWRSIFITVTR